MEIKPIERPPEFRTCKIPQEILNQIPERERPAAIALDRRQQEFEWVVGTVIQLWNIIAATQTRQAKAKDQMSRAILYLVNAAVAILTTLIVHRLTKE